MIFFACRPGFKTPPDALVVGLEATSPTGAALAATPNISQLLHNGLFHLSERMEIEPDLAESYEFLPPKKYKIHLRDGVRFHNGRQLTAEDVKATLESGLPQQISEKIESMNVATPRDLEIELKEPFAPFLAALTIGIFPAGGDPNIGTGPFQLERYDPTGEVVLKRFDGFRIRFRVIPDDNLRVLELKNGRIDLLQNSVPSSLIASLKDDPGLVIETTEGTNMTCLGFNLRAGDPSGHPPVPLQDRTGQARFDLANPLRNPDVREAIAIALDVPALIEYRMAGLARQATGVLSPIHWAREGEVMTYLYDPAKARERLDRAGYPDPDGAGPRPRMTLTYGTSTKRDRIGLARLIARALGEVGIEVKVMPSDESSSLDLYSLTWTGSAEPDFSAFAGRGGYENPAIDLLTADARVEMDRQKRKEIYSMIQKVLSQDIPIVPLWYEDNYAVFSRRVKGLQIRPNGSFEWATAVRKE